VKCMSYSCVMLTIRMHNTFCVCEREPVRVCVSASEREYVGVCVCASEREQARVCVSASEREQARESM